jgi:hypothetical protein
MEPITCFPKRCSPDSATSQYFRLAQETPFGKFTAENSVLYDPVCMLHESAGSTLFCMASHITDPFLGSENILLVYCESTECIQLVPPQFLVPSHILALQPYEPGLSADQVREQFGVDRAVKLASNENPLGVSPLAVEHARRALVNMFLYPDGGLALRRKLAERFSLKLENVIAGAGSEGIMANIVRTFLCDEDEVLTTEAAFSGISSQPRSRISYSTVSKLAL